MNLSLRPSQLKLNYSDADVKAFITEYITSYTHSARRFIHTHVLKASFWFLGRV